MTHHNTLPHWASDMAAAGPGGAEFASRRLDPSLHDTLDDRLLELLCDAAAMLWHHADEAERDWARCIRQLDELACKAAAARTKAERKAAADRYAQVVHNMQWLAEAMGDGE
ncbi:MAG: hypothetical protein KC766_20435 [Myxococcales bacterium]|nr:hypothetical protein [Myxococcales bacterium]